ncbi:amino acid adenylation domain-containing protein [Streptomyces sp. NPDC006430]|uniref:amino acid adenylation domain-containing protein n=1 Tax=Streptomyces sp. NPDC006430 TaxID=3154299 RepID=UPI0033B02685
MSSPATQPAEGRDPDSGDRVPQSFGQRRLWFLDRLTPHSAEYVEPWAIRLRGCLNVAALCAALDAIVARHEVLRGGFDVVDGEPVQRIDPPEQVALEQVDLTADGERDPAALRRLEELIACQTARPIDVKRGPLLRAVLAILGPDDHALVVTVHHIVWDGWSAAVFGNELSALYGAVVADGSVSDALSPLPVQYGDYALWQREWLRDDELERRLDYWGGRLAGAVATELAPDRTRRPVRGTTGATSAFRIPAGLVTRLRDLGQEHGATLYMTLLAAFDVLLARYTGSTDVVIGTPLAGRGRREAEDLIGFFVNTVILRVDLGGDPSFTEALSRVREAALDAHAHQDAPFDQIVDRLGVERDLSRTPLYQISFVLQNNPEAALDLPGLHTERIPAQNPAARTDLTFDLRELGDGSVEGVIIYAAALFEQATMDRLADHFVRLLESAGARPHSRISELEFVTDAELHQLVVAANDTARPRSWEPVHRVIARQATDIPDATAVVAGQIQLTYAELDARVNRLARHLRDLGAGPESAVAVCLERGPDLVVALLAVLKAGGAYVPLDPGHPGERLAHILTDSGARIIVTGSASVPGPIAAGDIVHVRLDDDRERIESQDLSDPHYPVDPDALAYIIYTSGTTGRPKGVSVSHRGLINYLWWTVEQYTRYGGRGTALFSSVAFDLVVPNLYTPLLIGQPVYLLPQDFEVAGLGQLLLDVGPLAFVKLAPGHLELIAAQLGPGQPAKMAALVIAAGDSFTSRLANHWLELAGAGKTRLAAEYGPTEITIGNSAHFVEGPVTDELVSIGTPIPNTTAYVLDASLRPLPAGVVGEVYVGGAGVARGYHGLPALTADRFVPDPYGPPGSRLYRTGDLAKVLPGGDFGFVGRVDTQLKVRGYRVEAGEVENALARHPDVDAAVVTVREVGPGDHELVAHVVPGRDRVLSADALRAFLGERLPSYMIPAAFVPLDRFPVTSNGKVDLRALPAPGRPARGAVEYKAPWTPAQRDVAEVMGTVLGGAQVGADDRFFDIGGDSIRAVALVGPLRAKGYTVSVRDVFEHPTVARLAEAIGERDVKTAAAPVLTSFQLLAEGDRKRLPDGVVDAYPLPLSQAGMLYEMSRGDERPDYQVIGSFYITDDGPFSERAFEHAVSGAVARHEALRTSFDLVSYSEPLQLVHVEASPLISIHDLRGQDGDQDLTVRSWIEEQRRLPFALDRAPLIRVAVHLLSDEAWRLTLVQCHAVLDGWSEHTLLSDLLARYRTARQGGTAAGQVAESGRARFADLIPLERAALSDARTRRFWEERLRGAVRFAVPEAWRDGSAPGGDIYYQVGVPFTDLEEDLRRLAAATGVPLNVVMHTAYLRTMATVSGNRRFCTGLVCNVRPEETGGDQVLGMFLNTVPFVCDPTSTTWRDLVAEVFAEHRALSPHRRYPLPEMQRRWGGGERLVDTLFNYVDFHVVDHDLVDVTRTIEAGQGEVAFDITAMNGTAVVTGRADRIGREHALLLARVYRRVLELMVADPDGDPRGNVLPDDDLRAALNSAEASPGELPRLCVHELFSQQAARSPGATAVVDERERLSYAELDARADRLASRLREAGVGLEVPVGVCLPRSVELAVGLLAVLKAGGAFVPLDPGHPLDRSHAILRETKAAAVLTAPSTAGLFDGLHCVVITPDGEAGAASPTVRAATLPSLASSPDNAAYVVYTSGSTGAPKGAVNTHQGLVNRVLSGIRLHGVRTSDRILQATRLSFDPAIYQIFVPLLAGASVVMAPDGAERSSAELVRLLARHDITGLELVPSVLRALADEPRLSEATGLRWLTSAGEALHADLCDRLARHSDAQMWNAYGPAECAIGVTDRRWRPGQDLGLVPLGRAIDNIRLLVLDAQGLPVPAGVPGELYVGGAGVGRGYVAAPALTAERFVPNPYGPSGSRLYRTGDMVRRSLDGELEFLGRIDHQVKVNGVRVELEEVEHALLGHPRVAAAAVTARTGDDGNSRLVAYVLGEPADGVPGDTEGITSAGLREFLRTRLPEDRVPSSFVRLDEFPLTDSGKIDRAALPSLATGEDLRPPHTPPATEAERIVARIWTDVLGVQGIGATDDFFQLGGHSLLLTRLAALLGTETGRNVPVRELFRAYTVRAQAQLIGAGHDTLPPIRPVGRHLPHPLSFAQQRLWFLDRLNPGSAQYTLPLFVRPPASAGAGAVRRALEELAVRHEALRTRYALIDGEPRQVIEDGVLVDLRVVEARPHEIPALTAGQLARGFDLERGPVWRALMITAPDEQPLLLVTVHHIACDGWSAVTLERDVLELLAARLQHRAPALPELPVRYADYAVWQRGRLAAGELEDQLAYWRNQLAGLAQLELPTDRPRPAGRDPLGAAIGFTVPADIARAVLAVGRRHGGTPFMTLLAAFAALLARYSGQSDIAIGTPVAGRLHPDVGDIVGCFLNTVVLRCDTSGDVAFGELVDRIRATTLAAQSAQEAPFELLVEELAPDRDLSRNPLVQVVFDLHDEGVTGLAAEDTRFDGLGGDWRGAQVDINLTVSRRADDSVDAVLEYATALFDEATVRRFAQHYVRLLESVATAENSRLSRLEILSGPERHRLVHEWNDTAVERALRPAHEVIARQAAATPEAVAVRVSGAYLSYADLDRGANRLARHLCAHGVGPESVVGICLDRGPDLITAFLAVWKAGAAYVPLDPAHPRDRLAYMLGDADARHVLTQTDHSAGLAAAHDAEYILVDRDRTAIDAHDGTALPPTDPDALAYIIYTSGSTGRPKGVLIGHRGLANYLEWTVEDYTRQDTGGTPLFSSVAYDMVVPDLYTALMTGQPVHLLPPRFDVTELGRLLDEAGPFAFIKLTPGHLDLLTAQLTPDQAAGLAGTLVVGADSFPSTVLDRWLALAGPNGPRLLNEYGPTEISVANSTHIIDGPEPGSIVPIGRPLPNTTAHVLAPGLNPVPVGVVGELFIGGVGLARGYRNLPALTAERFLPDPFSDRPGGRLYRTGDLARHRPDGELEFLGRTDEQIKLRGHRIEPGEVAAALTSHPGVRDAFVTADGGSRRLIAYCVPSADALPGPAELAEHCSARLPDHMVPDLYVPLDRIPLNANGKADRGALPAPDAAAGPAPDDTPPRNALEQRLADAWADLLGITGGFGVHRSFFHLGGNSILAARLVVRLQEEFDVALPLRTVFEHATVAAMAQAVEAVIRAEIAAMSDAEIRSYATDRDRFDPAREAR